jgi:hypothetical protein
MRPRQGPRAQSRVSLHETQIEAFDDRADLGIAELADVEVAAAEALRPSQEYVACRLHQTRAGHEQCQQLGSDSR